MNVLGVILAILLLMLFVYKRINLILATLLGVFILSLSNKIPFYNLLYNSYSIALANFLAKYFLVFVTNALFGKVMEETLLVSAFSNMIGRWFGNRNAVYGALLITAMLSYGGISVFVIVFTVYPIFLVTFQKADLPRKFIPACIMSATCTVPLSMFPGGTQLNNIIPTRYIGTTPMASPVISIVAATMTTGLIFFYFRYIFGKARARKEHFIMTNEIQRKIHNIEADTILDSMKEVIQIGKESGVKIHYSHFKVCGRKNWDKIDGMIQLLEEAEKEGIDVSFDQYPYVAGSTMLGVILPPWVHDGGTNKVIERLNDPELRKKMVYDIEHGIPGWDNFVDFAGLDQIYVTSVKTDKNKDAVGLSLIELGKLRGKDPYDATFDLLRDEENAVGMVDFYGTEDHVKLFMKRPEMNVCTDGLLGGKPHPRVYGAFPRVLGKYVREDKALTLEQAVYKMTGKPAATFNIKNRGQIKEGAYADITVFNPDTVIDKGTFTDPTQYPEGIEYVMVNGVFEVAGGKYTGRRNGTVLRKKGKEVVK